MNVSRETSFRRQDEGCLGSHDNHTTTVSRETKLKSATPFFELRDAVVRRAGRSILTVGRFSLAEGESMVVLGPNGSGKSTFVSLVTREVLPLYREEPPVKFRGNPRATLDDVKRCLGVVSSSMQDQMTVHMPAIDVVVGGLYGCLGVPKHVTATPADYERARAQLEFLGMADAAKRDVMTLSTGQARRVLIARALVHDPQMLVCDEPCTGLDPEGMYHVRRTMSKIAQKGCAVLLVTHYPEDIVQEIDRVVLIKEGRMLADGSKSELLTAEHMTALFDVPLQVSHTNGRYALVDASA